MSPTVEQVNERYGQRVNKATKKRENRERKRKTY